MATVGTDHSNPQRTGLRPRGYVRRRDRLSETDKKRSRRAQRRLIEISPTYWAVEQEKVDSADERQRRWNVFTKHGDFSMAYSTAVQPLLKYHEHSDYDGFIAYRRRWGMTFALGDPVVAVENRAALINSFCDQHPGATFCQVSEPIADILDSLGFYINELGVDTSLDLPNYDFSGKEKEWLRYACNWMQRRGYVIKECGFDDVNEVDVEAVSEGWRNTRTIRKRESRFINRPIVISEPEQDVRKFYLFDSEKRMLAFIFLDPLFRDGQIIGYVTVVKRRHPDAPKYAEAAMMKAVIEKLKSEHVAELRLGLSPGAWLEDNRYKKRNWCTSKLFQTMFRSRMMNRYFYNLVGHASYKRRFRGSEEKVYFASASRFNSPRLVALIGLCGFG